MTFRLVLDPIACDGHGICAELFPEGIRLDDWGYPILAPGDVPHGLAGARPSRRDRLPEAGAHDRPWRPAVAPGRAARSVRPGPRRTAEAGAAHVAVADPGERRPTWTPRRPADAMTRQQSGPIRRAGLRRVPVGPARRAPSPGELASDLRPSCGPCGGGTTPRITRTVITPAATKATVAAMPAIRPIVDQAKVESSSPRNVSPLKRVLRWLVMASALVCSSATAAVLCPASFAVWTCRLGRGLRGPEVGVRRAVGDAVEVVGDVAGVGLGVGARRDLLTGVADEVLAAFLLEAGPVREVDVLRGELLADVVVGEVAAPRQQAAGDGEHDGDHGACAHEHGIDRPPADRDDGRLLVRVAETSCPATC